MSAPSSSQADAAALGKKADDINAVLSSKKRRNDYTAAIRKKKFDRWLEGHRYYSSGGKAYSHINASALTSREGAGDDDGAGEGDGQGDFEVKNSQTQNSASRQGANCSTGHNSRCHAGIIGFLHHITLGYVFFFSDP